MRVRVTGTAGGAGQCQGSRRGWSLPEVAGGAD